jgi:uncharacterized protein with PCYCGC motif
MGRKSSSKGQVVAVPAPGTPKRGLNPVLLGAIVVAVLCVGVFAFWRGDETPAAASSTSAGVSPTSAPQDAVAAPQGAVAAPITPVIEASTKAVASMGPHKQSNLPPVPFRGYAPPRPPEVVAAAFQFAAEHPEVLSYVPCFCGCEHSGHKGNHDCFVRSRAANGDVIEWDEHGVECAVCIDVATRSRQMLASGASVRDIRAAVEKEFAPNFPSMTPTVKPPSVDHAH